MFQRIIVPLDGSPRAERVLPIAGRIAEATGGSIILVRVLNLAADLNWQMAALPMYLGECVNAEEEGARKYLKKVANFDCLKNVNVVTQILEGKPDECILSFSEEIQADLIVMSSHGYTGFKRFMMGSVSRSVGRRSKIPALIMREKNLPTEHEIYESDLPLRIMVALDGSRAAEVILPVAIELSRAVSIDHKAHLHLAMVLPDSHRKADNTTGEYNKAIREAQAYLTGVLHQLRAQKAYEDSLELTSSISLQSSISDALVELAELGNSMEGVSTITSCDVIAMATHGRHGFERLLYSSVTEKVLDATCMPVLVVRAAWEEPVIDTAMEQEQLERDVDRLPTWAGLL